MLNKSELSKILFSKAEEWKIGITGQSIEDDALFLFWDSIGEYNRRLEPMSSDEIEEACHLAARVFVAFNKPDMPGVELLEAFFLKETPR